MKLAFLILLGIFITLAGETQAYGRRGNATLIPSHQWKSESGHVYEFRELTFENVHQFSCDLATEPEAISGAPFSYLRVAALGDSAQLTFDSTPKFMETPFSFLGGSEGSLVLYVVQKNVVMDVRSANQLVAGGRPRTLIKTSKVAAPFAIKLSLDWHHAEQVTENEPGDVVYRGSASLTGTATGTLTTSNGEKLKLDGRAVSCSGQEYSNLPFGR